MNIEVYSIKSFTGTSLKNRLESALAEQNLPYEVVEINNVDEFIKAGLTSVPAVKIGNKIIEHHDDNSFDATIQKALRLIIGERDRNILVPVDFSPESIHALKYARMMASHLDMGITVAHVHQPLFDPITGSAFDIEMLQKNKQRLEEMVIGLEWDEYRMGHHVPMTTHFETGDITSSLIHLAENDKFDMIIMSTMAEDSFLKRIVGSISTQVSRKGSKPVLIVPPDAPIKFPGKIVFGMTHDLLNGLPLQNILKFAIEHKVIIDFVYAVNDPEQFRQLRNRLYERLMHHDDLCGFNIRQVNYRQGQIHEALAEYVKAHHAGLLVLVTRHRNFRESLTHQSVSKKAVLHPEFPVMIMHTLEPSPITHN